MKLPKQKIIVIVSIIVCLLIAGGITYAATRPNVDNTKSVTGASSHNKSEEQQPPSSSDSKVAPATVKVKTPTVATTQPSQPTLPTDNSAKCIAIYNEAATDLNLLNKQIQAQLEKMKEIMSSEQLAESFGGISPLKQASYTRDYNAANDEAEKLQAQYTKDRENYTDQIVGLENSNSPGCKTAFQNLSAAQDN